MRRVNSDFVITPQAAENSAEQTGAQFDCEAGRL
jgi:hypothetical protein